MTLYRAFSKQHLAFIENEIVKAEADVNALNQFRRNQGMAIEWSKADQTLFNLDEFRLSILKFRAALDLEQLAQLDADELAA